MDPLVIRRDSFIILREVIHQNISSQLKKLAKLQSCKDSNAQTPACTLVQLGDPCTERQRYRQHPQTIIRIASYYRSRITIRIIIRQSYSLHFEIYTELPCKAVTLHVRWQSPSAPKTYRSHILLLHT